MINFYQFLRKKFSEYSESSGQQGTAIDDIAIKPTGLILADFSNALVRTRRINNINEWKNMTDEELDAFGAKFFKPRIIGAFASGFVRIWFDYKFDFEISENFRAISGSSLKYRAIQPGYISKNSFRKASDGFGAYYVDVPIIAESEGSSYNLEPGRITFISGVDFQYKTVTNPEKIQNGLNRETNEQYYKRLRYSINDGSMMNIRSMYSRLPEFFPSIISMYVANPGNKYMTRDLVSGEDLSSQSKTASYLGKTQGNTMVKHVAFYGSFPPEAWSKYADYLAGQSIPSAFDRPLTIEASDNTQMDPAYHGYPLDQEATNEMYAGLFFNDYSGYMQYSTQNLFDIYEEKIGLDPVIVPNTSWMYGSHLRNSGEFGDFVDGVGPIDVMSFQNNIIKLAGGCQEAISVSKNIKKRINVKMTGSFTWPETAESFNSNLQFMIGGKNDFVVDAFSGIGFGIRLTGEYVEGSSDKNAIIYIAHSERYGSAQVFAASEDIIPGSGVPSPGQHISVGDMSALAETSFNIKPGEPYSFEFILYDDLRVTLYIEKENPIGSEPDNEKFFRFSLSSQPLKLFKQELLNPFSSHYGTMMKVTLETKSKSPADIWEVADLNVFDVDAHKSNMLFAIDVGKMEDPLTIYMRAFGRGAVQGLAYEGYEAYIWDKEAHSPASSAHSELTNGGWSPLDGISNSDGSKQLTTGLLSHTIQNSDRYIVNSRYGKMIFILVQTTGSSKASIKYGGDFSDDIVSTLKVDYIKVVSRASQLYHANNKADIYVVTYQNSEQPEVVTSVLTKTSFDSFFEMNAYNGCKMPVVEIIAIFSGGAAEEVSAIAPTEYSIILSGDELHSSSKETVLIALRDSSINTITVQYRAFPIISQIQEFFDGTDYGKIFGDILIKHKIPVNISFSLSCTSELNTEQIIDEIRKYFDKNDGRVFSVNEMVRYIYDNGIATSVKEPVVVSYSKYNDEWQIESGEFTDLLTIKEIEFFRIQDLTVQKL